jgi:lipopolysaccharide cholinephosphotransferase
VLEKVVKESGLSLPHGIYVDVFPLVACPKTFFEKICWKLSGICLRLKTSAILTIGERKTFRSKVVGAFSGVLRFLYPKVVDNQTAAIAHEDRARRYPYVNTGCCGWYVVGIQDVIAPIPVAFFGKPKYLPFESIKVPVPSNFLGYLKYKFGNYMELPPKDMRHPTHGNTEFAPWRLGPTGTDCRKK